MSFLSPEVVVWPNTHINDPYLWYFSRSNPLLSLAKCSYERVLMGLTGCKLGQVERPCYAGILRTRDCIRSLVFL